MKLENGDLLITPKEIRCPIVSTHLRMRADCGDGSRSENATMQKKPLPYLPKEAFDVSSRGFN